VGETILHLDLPHIPHHSNPAHNNRLDHPSNKTHDRLFVEQVVLRMARQSTVLGSGFPEVQVEWVAEVA